MKTILPETFQKVKVMGGTRLIGVSDQSYQPTLSQLRAFVAVAKYRHFGTAATRLNVSQPTLSQALAALENGLGVHLIERSTRRVLVTPAGARLLPQAQVILDAADGFVAAAAGAPTDCPARSVWGSYPRWPPTCCRSCFPRSV